MSECHYKNHLQKFIDAQHKSLTRAVRLYLSEEAQPTVSQQRGCIKKKLKRCIIKPTFRTLFLGMKDLHHKATIFHAYGVFRSWLGIFYKDDKPRAFFKSLRTEIFVAKEVSSVAKTFGCGIFGLNQRMLRKGAEREIKPSEIRF